MEAKPSRIWFRRGSGINGLALGVGIVSHRIGGADDSSPQIMSIPELQPLRHGEYQVHRFHPSTNPANWAPLATNRLGTDPLCFSDPASTNLSKCFYRAVLAP
jgi:hypothetical protein